MKILTQLWETFKAVGVNKHVNTKWDAERKLFIVGDGLSCKTIDDGPTPINWHQCFHYTEKIITPSEHTKGGRVWERCRNLAGPGFKPSFCLVHIEAEKQLYRNNDPLLEKATTQVISGKDTYRYCRWGPCSVKIFSDNEYCEHHMVFITEQRRKNQVVFDPIEDCGCMGYCDTHLNQSPEDAAAELAFHNEAEDIDEDFNRKIGWGQLRYRRSRKQLPMQQQETVHFKLEMRGSRDYIDLFHAMLHLCDSDYPLDPFRKNSAIPAKCDNCGGYIWNNAIISASDIKKAAKQAGITIKVRTYLPESTCKKKVRGANA